jgi:hypothetical protein
LIDEEPPALVTNVDVVPSIEQNDSNLAEAAVQVISGSGLEDAGVGSQAEEQTDQEVLIYKYHNI